jgi:hypothetical protein
MLIIQEPIPRTPKNIIFPGNIMPLKTTRKKPKPKSSSIKDLDIVSETKSPSKSILRSKKTSPSPSQKKNKKSRLIFFDEEKMKTFMSQVWKEMTRKHGVIEHLQEKLNDNTNKSKKRSLRIRKESVSIDKKQLRRKASKRKSSRKISRSGKNTKSKKQIKVEREKRKMICTDQVRRPPLRKNIKERGYFSTKSNLVKSEIDLTNFQSKEKSFKKKRKKKVQSRRSSTVDVNKNKEPLFKPKKVKAAVKSKNNLRSFE